MPARPRCAPPSRCSARRDPAPGGRRIAVLGDMLELGDAARAPPRRAGRAARSRPASISSSPSARRCARSTTRCPQQHARRPCRDLRRAGGASSSDRAARRRCRRGQRLARQPHGRHRQALARRGEPAAKRRARARAGGMLYHLLVPARRSVRAVQPVPLPHLPLGRRGGDRAVHQLRLRAARSSPGSNRSRREGQPIRLDGPEGHLRAQEGHADHGRLPDPARRSPSRPCSGPISPTAMSGSCCWSPPASARSASSTTTRS